MKTFQWKALLPVIMAFVVLLLSIADRNSGIGIYTYFALLLVITSLFMLWGKTDKLQTQITDLKRELEEMKRKE